MLVFRENGVWRQWVGQPIARPEGLPEEQFNLSPQVESVWTDDDLSVWGLKRVQPFVIPASPDEQGRMVTGTEFVIHDDGTVTQEPTYRDSTEQEIDTYRQRLTYGIPNALNQALAPILAYYPEAEKSGWVAKESEARAYKASQTQDLTVAPLLTGLATLQSPSSDDAARKDEVGALADVVIVKADSFRALSVKSESIRIQFQNALSTAITFAELNAIKAQFETVAAQFAQAILKSL